MARSASGPAGAVTLTLEPPSPSQAPAARRPAQQETLVLRLKMPKKKVSWKDGTVDNEFLGRRSSKKCCIFHKQKPFDEDASSDEDGGHGPEGSGGAGLSGCCSHDEDHCSQ